MRKGQREQQTPAPSPRADDYPAFSAEIVTLLDEARRQSARAVNALLTATYWEIGRRIVEFEQKGKRRAEYGEELLARLSRDLTARSGRGFGVDNLQRMRAFFTTHPQTRIHATLSRKSWPLSPQQAPPAEATALPEQSPSDEATSQRSGPVPENLQTLVLGSLRGYLSALAQAFPLSWSHYVRLLSVQDPAARDFYEAEALRGGWSIRQLHRQIGTLFYERTALSRNKAAMLTQGAKAKPGDVVTAEEEIKDPYILEFLGLKDEYSETDLEEALIRHLEHFLLELGSDFTFAARQKRIRVGNAWYRIDLLFYHRRLRCLVIIDLKVGAFTHADAGQMNLYVNYAAEHLTLPDENPPVGLILCSESDAAVAHYALGSLSNTIMAAQYRLVLPDPKDLEAEIAKTRRMLEPPARKGSCPDA